MYANVVIPSEGAAWIETISKDIDRAVFAGCADVIRPFDIVAGFSQEGPGVTFDICRSHMFISPAETGLLRQRECGWMASLRLANHMTGLQNRRRHFGRV